MGNNRRLDTAVSILKLLILLGIVVVIPLYIFFYHGDFISEFKSLDDVTAFLQRYKLASIPIYIGLQALQIVISILPGQAFQFAAGYLYRFLPGLIFSLAGAVLGTTISFYLAKLLMKGIMLLPFGMIVTFFPRAMPSSTVAKNSEFARVILSMVTKLTIF